MDVFWLVVTGMLLFVSLFALGCGATLSRASGSADRREAEMVSDEAVIEEELPVELLRARIENKIRALRRKEIALEYQLAQITIGERLNEYIQQTD